RLSILVANARVQGDGAAIDIEGAIRRLARTDVVVIVVTRGGGSTEDLWAFNEERVARAIYDSPVPVISAVGHEVDVTLADFAADKRAATPTHAAKEVAPIRRDQLARLESIDARLRRVARNGLALRSHRVAALRAGLEDPRRRITERRLRLFDISDRTAE